MTALLRRFARDEEGQSMVFAALVLFVLACMLILVLNVGRGVHRGILLQNAADGAALTGAVWEARGLNLVAQINGEMVQVMTIGVVVVGVAGLTSLLGVGGVLQCYVPWILNKLFNVMAELSRMERWVAAFWPPLVEGQVLAAGGRDLPGVWALPLPMIPSPDAGADESGRLGLHASPSAPGEMTGEVMNRAWSAGDRLVRSLTGGGISLETLARRFGGIFGFDLKGRFLGMVEGAVNRLSFEGGMRVSSDKEFAYGPDDYDRATRVAAGRWPDEGAVNAGGGEAPPCRLDRPRNVVWTLDREIWEPACTPGGCASAPARRERWKFVDRGLRRSWGPGGGGVDWSAALLEGGPPPLDPWRNPRTNPILPLLRASGVVPRVRDVPRGCPDGEARVSQGLPSSCPGERWTFAGLSARATENCRYAEGGVPPGGVTPYRLHDDFERRQWVAAIAYLPPRSEGGPLERWVPPAQAEWGALSVARARVVTRRNRPGGIPLTPDFEAHLVAFQGAGDEGAPPGLLGRALGRIERAVLH